MTSTQDKPHTALTLTENLPTSAMETPFGDLLREYRERRGLTQQAAALRLRVSRPTVAQWEANRHLPSRERVRELDRALEAGGALVAALDAAVGAGRGTRGRVPEQRTAAPPSGPTVLQVTKDARRVLDEQLCFDDEGRPLGWRYNLVSSTNRPPSTLSTIYGLGALALLGGPDRHTPAIVERIARQGVDANGRIRGWHASAQGAPRMEATAAASLS